MACRRRFPVCLPVPVVETSKRSKPSTFLNDNPPQDQRMAAAGEMLTGDFQVSHGASIADLLEIHRLASSVYDSAIVLPISKLQQWHSVSPAYWWLCKSQGSLVGFLCALPLREECFQQSLASCEFDETSIDQQHLVDFGGGDKKLDVYICSFVVDRRYQRCSPVSTLLKTAFIAAISRMGVRQLSAHVVSAAGEKVMKSMGLSRLKTNNTNRTTNQGRKKTQAAFSSDNEMKNIEEDEEGRLVERFPCVMVS